MDVSEAPTLANLASERSTTHEEEAEPPWFTVSDILHIADAG